MKRIPVSGGRAFALVDDADYGAVADRRWRMNGGGYVISGRERPVYLHREIMGHPSAFVDHENGNKLDCRRSNLRVCTQSQNMQNRAPRVVGNSRFRGVCWDKSVGAWKAHAKTGGRKRHIGYFPNELDAAIAAESFRQEHMPFAAPDAELLAALAQPEQMAACERCGFVPEHKSQLDIHHRDGDRANMARANLGTLCANCHRLVHVEAA